MPYHKLTAVLLLASQFLVAGGSCALHHLASPPQGGEGPAQGQACGVHCSHCLVPRQTTNTAHTEGLRDGRAIPGHRADECVVCRPFSQLLIAAVASERPAFTDFAQYRMVEPRADRGAAARRPSLPRAPPPSA